MTCIYPFPKSTLVRLLAAVVFRRKLSFREIAVSCTNLLDPPLKVYGRENIPGHGGAVLTINHFTRPGFQAWWVALAASSVIPSEVHWVQSNAWRMTGWQRPLSGVTRWLFPQVAHVLGFTAMPPIPPDPWEVEQRAQAVREVLSVVRNNPQTLIGLAPEGSDEEQHCLKMPPPGTGRFMLLLSNLGLVFLPVGFFEDSASPCVRFGSPYRLNVPEGLSHAERDHQAAAIVMSAIAAELPGELQGSFGPVR
jgi:hypothetical protein